MSNSPQTPGQNLASLALSEIAPLPTSQIHAVAGQISASNRTLDLLKGPPGAGQSMVLKAVVEQFKNAGYEVVASALSWKGSQVAQSILSAPRVNGEILSVALHRLVEAGFGGKPALVVLHDADEVSPGLLADLLEAAKENQAPVKVLAVFNAPARNSALERLLETTEYPVFGVPSIILSSRLVSRPTRPETEAARPRNPSP